MPDEGIAEGQNQEITACGVIRGGGLRLGVLEEGTACRVKRSVQRGCL